LATSGKTISVHLDKESLEDFELLYEMEGLGTSKMLRLLVDQAIADMLPRITKALKQVDTEAQRKKARLEKMRERLSSAPS
jgi:hypothetical protein